VFFLILFQIFVKTGCKWWVGFFVGNIFGWRKPQYKHTHTSPSWCRERFLFFTASNYSPRQVWETFCGFSRGSTSVVGYWCNNTHEILIV